MIWWILISSGIGFCLSYYIYHKKERNEKLVCVIGDDCDKVVRSKYSALLGVDNEGLGMFYYGLVAVTAVALLAVPGSTVTLLPLLATAGGLAALLSVILIFIQAFVIKEWCEYCIVSAGLSLFIFIIELVAI